MLDALGEDCRLCLVPSFSGNPALVHVEKDDTGKHTLR